MDETRRPRVALVIPALDERRAIVQVLRDVPREWVDEVVVVDNGSRDGTEDVARAAGATVLREPRRGYGSACLRGLAYLREQPPDVVVFLDADHSDHPEQLPRLLAPIVDEGYELVIGSRKLGNAEPGALAPQARFGNWLAVTLVRWLYGFRYTDLGPFRAARWDALERLEMRDPDYGWTAEMQVKAVRRGLRVTEVPVDYRRRVGRSKITGTVSGVVRAGWKIITTVLRGDT